MATRGSSVTTNHLRIEYRSLESLKVNRRNPRIHSNKQIRQIARSIEEFGAIMPAVVDRNSQIIVGHGRVQAAQLLGIKEFPTISVEHLTEAQAKAFAIADNKLTENSTWDEQLLAEQLRSLSEEIDFDIEVTGFEVGEIDVMIEGSAPINGANDSADEFAGA
jgi:ParB/RepB/Spo0J family partition protein